MKTKIYHLAICLLVIGNTSFAQQWSGSSTTSGTIYRDGSVGVGTSNTITKLTVATTSQGDGIWLASSSTPNIAVLANMGQGSWNGLTQNGDNMILWKGSNIDQTDAGALVIGTWSNYNNGIRILPSGNIGIGTAFPGSFKLAVEGKIGAREVHVTSVNPWPDYVFSNQYKLKNLNTLEDYIKKNNRLPDMPSAEEVKNDGLELGKMNTRVVEKIEELTLYIIELNKKIEKLEKDNASLRKQINK